MLEAFYDNIPFLINYGLIINAEIGLIFPRTNGMTDGWSETDVMCFIKLYLYICSSKFVKQISIHSVFNT